MGEIIDLGNDPVQPIDLLNDNVIELFAKIGVVETLRQKLGKVLIATSGFRIS